ncbi:hypothetical protein Ahy_A03g016155 [Arachis hypogaea]|uniref:Cytochrome P450 n=1 Tax=Arachis hypogaea TaxID=3818 RepID=A0A445E2E3_ARAHY|nr:hypothetical protein Ahy_A03g016155 [Arachis hypogaea]
MGSVASPQQSTNNEEASTRDIETHAGHNQLLNESNASKIKYLQNIITETLRIYPVAPLLIPHESSSDCKVCDYDIPKGTMLLANLWTLQKDPNLWADPTRFVSERFDDNGDGSKVCYNMIPFGVGRRVCPGGVLAKHVMGHALGALFRCFEWEKIEDQVDMAEGIGLTLPKAQSLQTLFPIELRMPLLRELLKKKVKTRLPLPLFGSNNF